MEIKTNQRGNRWVFPLCLGLSALFLMICTKSSFLYPINDWVDANIYFTIGKGMMHGRVPYLDLYDQKGPVAFFLYGLASLVSGTSFFGVYLLETVAFAFFLFAAYQILSLYLTENAVLALPLLGACILGSLSFSHGGSLEELVLPLFAWSFYDTLKYFKTVYPKRVPLRMIAVNALFAGVMLFAKFTFLAFYVAWMGVIAVSQFVIRDWKHALSACLVFLGVMLGAGIPWLVYFGANGALDDFFTYYFYQNLFGYSYLEPPLLQNAVLAIVKGVAAFFYRNPQISVFIVLGAVWFTSRKRGEVRPIEKINFWLLAGLLAAGIYCGGQGYRYYGLVLTPFMVLGFVPLLRLWNRCAAGRIRGRALKAALYAVLAAVMVTLAFFTTDNRYLLSVKKEDTPQARFAAIMDEQKTEPAISLFCYAFPDAGFYLQADVIPEYRFFATANVNLPEMTQEQNRYLSEKSAEFVVTRNRDEGPEGYALIETQTFWSEGYDDVFRLYQRLA